MTTPERLIEHGTEFERELLASARLDAGGDGGRKRAVVAMAAVLSTAATTGTTAGASAGVISAGVRVKWVGVALVNLGVAGASVRVGSSLVSTRSVAPSTNGALVRHGAGPSSLSVPNRDREPGAAAAMSPASIATAVATEMPPRRWRLTQALSSIAAAGSIAIRPWMLRNSVVATAHHSSMCYRPRRRTRPDDERAPATPTTC